jgi:hypothetical protein
MKYMKEGLEAAYFIWPKLSEGNAKACVEFVETNQHPDTVGLGVCVVEKYFEQFGEAPPPRFKMPFQD